MSVRKCATCDHILCDNLIMIGNEYLWICDDCLEEYGDTPLKHFIERD